MQHWFVSTHHLASGNRDPGQPWMLTAPDMTAFGGPARPFFTAVKDGVKRGDLLWVWDAKQKSIGHVFRTLARHSADDGDGFIAHPFWPVPNVPAVYWDVELVQKLVKPIARDRLYEIYLATDNGVTGYRMFTKQGPVLNRSIYCYGPLTDSMVACFQTEAREGAEERTKKRRGSEVAGREELSQFSLESGKLYRRVDIHKAYGGQQQGGISTPTNAPFVILFTGEAGQQYGYHDGWDENGVFLYAGEGQRGDMRFLRGNRAVRDHAVEGKDLLLFETLGKGKRVRFCGPFACASYEIRFGPDVDGNNRKAIVFQLVPLHGALAVEESSGTGTMGAGPRKSLKELRDAALKAANIEPSAGSKEAKRTYYERSNTVRDYVLARAKGKCECCKAAAPFMRNNGSPYLAPHHIRRLSDGGPDHPSWIAAICPTCHREIHYGAEGIAKNSLLQAHLISIEADSE